MAAKKKRHVARSPEDLAKKRDLLLDAAMTLLADKGFAKTTMSDVARVAGVGRGTVYWHFESKDDLFFDALHREADRMEAAMAMGTPPAGAADAFNQLVRGMFTAVDVEDAHNLFHAFLSIMGAAGPELQERLHDWFHDLYGRYNALLESLFEAGKADGSVRPDLDSTIAAAACISLLDAMFLQIEFGTVPSDPERLIAGVTDLLMNGFLASRSDP